MTIILYLPEFKKDILNKQLLRVGFIFIRHEFYWGKNVIDYTSNHKYMYMHIKAYSSTNTHYYDNIWNLVTGTCIKLF